MASILGLEASVRVDRGDVGRFRVGLLGLPIVSRCGEVEMACILGDSALGEAMYNLKEPHQCMLMLRHVLSHHIGDLRFVCLLVLRARLSGCYYVVLSDAKK